MDFWSTVCKTVRPMPSNSCLSCPVRLSVLSVCDMTLVYCDQTVGRIKMKLGMHLGLGLRHIVLHGNPAPRLLQKGDGAPEFTVHICCGQIAAWIKMPLGMEIGLGPGDFVLDGDPAPSPKRGRSLPLQFSAHVHCGQTAGWIKTTLGTEVGLGPGHIC